MKKKNKFKKFTAFISIIFIILICFILLPCLYSCKKDDNTANNINNNPDDSKVSDSGNKNNGETAVEVTNVYTSKEITDAIMAVYNSDEIPEAGMKYRFSGAEENSDNFIEPEEIGILITGSPIPVEDMIFAEDYAFCTPNGYNVFEIDVLKVKSEEKNNFDKVKNILDTRLARKLKFRGDVLNYMPIDIPILDNAKVITIGNYIILIATTDNNKADKVINDMFKSGNNLNIANPAVEDNNTPEENINLQTPVEIEENKPVSMDEIVNIEPEILFDFNELSILEETQAEQIPESSNSDSPKRKTPVPRVDVKQYSHNTSFLIGGKCEVGAMIRVTGGTEEIFTGSDYGDYLVEVPFASTGSTTLKLTAVSEGKQPSDEISFIVKPQKDISYFEDHGDYGVVIGYNYMSYFWDCMPDFLGTNLLKDSAISDLKTRTQKRIRDLKDKNCSAEIIYLLVPNTSRLWKEDVPRRYTYYEGDTLLRQWKEAVTSAGATVLDLTDLMFAHKYDEFKLWHKTDSHWTEYGAFLGYEALMNHIAQKFPDAAPRPITDFEFSNIEVNFGDIYATIGLNLSDLRETTTFVKFNFDPPHYNPDYNTGHVNIYDQNCVMKMSARPIHARVQFAHTTQTNLTGLNLPNAYFFRDSFEGPLHAFYTDRFANATFKGMWDYNFNLNQVVNTNPDYIIYIISERNIKNVLYN